MKVEELAEQFGIALQQELSARNPAEMPLIREQLEKDVLNSLREAYGDEVSDMEAFAELGQFYIRLGELKKTLPAAFDPREWFRHAQQMGVIQFEKPK